LIPTRRIAAAAVAAAFVLAGRSVAAPFEEPPIVLSAETLLPAGPLAGERFRVLDRVENDGFMNRWRIETDWGELEADSDRMLQVRLREIQALMRLEEVERTTAFLDAFEEALSDAWRAARQVVDQPVETAKRLPGGVSRMFSRTRRKAADLAQEAREEYHELKEDRAERQAESAAEEAAGTPAPDADPGGADSEDEARARRRERLEEAKEVARDVGEEARRFFQRKSGYRRARRGWARELGVDPYGDNEVLNRHLFRVSAASAAGGFSARLVPVPDIPGLSRLGDVKEIVYDLDALDLRLRNEKIFLELGFDRSFTDRLYEGGAWSDSLITDLADALRALHPVANLGSLMAWARSATTHDEARFQAAVAEQYAEMRRRGESIARLHEGDVFVSAVMTDGPAVVALAVDRLAWTEDWAKTWDLAYGQLLAEEGRPVELHLRGDASQAVRRRLAEQGVQLVERAF
jgi:hypothetical protein